MAKNDIILVDQVLAEAARASNVENDGRFFERFALEQVLKDRDLSAEEIDAGLVDGRNDGGVDAWYTFLDGELITDQADIPSRRGAAALEILVFTCKHHDTFRLDPVVSLFTSVNELLDLARDESRLSAHYNEEVLACRGIFREALVKTARANPQVSFAFHYVSRGDTESVGDAIQSRSDALLSSVHELVSNCKASFSYVGAKELLLAYRKLKDFSARITFEEGPLSRGASNYAGLATLTEYFRFITDEAGNLKKYLFESNVRDYMGRNYVNDSIEQTLRTQRTSSQEDFWWLNNGATIIADGAKVVGKELHLENVQLVNGLQTTESIYKYLAANASAKDDRCMLVKVLITDSKVLADRIILATNNQTKVDSASLRATEKIQRDIEDLLAIRGWFYDRRKNYYSNHGKPSSRIVSMSFMSWAILSVRLREPHLSGRARPKYMQHDAAYHRIFDERADLNVFLSALEICKGVEAAMMKLRLTYSPYESRNYATLYRFLYATMYVAAMSGKSHFSDKEIIDIGTKPINQNLITTLHEIASDARQNSFPTARKLHRSEAFQKAVIAQARSVGAKG